MVGSQIYLADVTIIGAGVMGMMSALELAEAGHIVSVFDKGQAGQEASWAVVELFRHYTRGGMHLRLRHSPHGRSRRFPI